MSLAGKGLWRAVEIDDPLDASTPLGSANVIVCTIGPAGGTDNNGHSFDYNSLDDWWADLYAYSAGSHTDRNGAGPTTIVGAPFWAECYGGVNLTSYYLWITLTNYTATNTHFLRIYGADGHRPDGLFDPRGLYDDTEMPQGAFCRVEASPAAFVLDHSYTRVDGLRILGNYVTGVHVNQLASDFVFVHSNVIEVRSNTGHLGSQGILTTLLPFEPDLQMASSVILRNNIVYGDGTGQDVGAFVTAVGTPSGGQNLSVTVYEDNNSALNVSGGAVGSYSGLFHARLTSTTGSGVASITFHRRNNLALKPANAYACYVDEKTGPNPGNMTFIYAADEYNLSNDGSADDFGNTTPGSCVTNVDAAEVVRNETTDAALRRGSPAAGAGADLSGLFAHDLRGRERAQWDIGALAYASGAHGATSTHPSSISTTL